MTINEQINETTMTLEALDNRVAELDTEITTAQAELEDAQRNGSDVQTFVIAQGRLALLLKELERLQTERPLVKQRELDETQRLLRDELNASKIKLDAARDRATAFLRENGWSKIDGGYLAKAVEMEDTVTELRIAFQNAINRSGNADWQAIAHFSDHWPMVRRKRV